MQQQLGRVTGHVEHGRSHGALSRLRSLVVVGNHWRAFAFVVALMFAGFTVIPFGQGFKDMSPPSKELMKLALEGRLQLSGSGHWVGTRLRFQGEARAAPGLQAQLANLLNILGRREGDRAILSFG